ncbi:MAG: phosphotransferase family protein [Acidimicrobiales bacterium]
MSATEAEALRDWLAERWGCPPSELAVAITGQSTAGARRRNLMLQIDGGPRPGRFVATVLPTADIAILSMADEAAVRTVARDHGVPVPEVVAVCVDESVLGGQFFVSEFHDGETIPRRLLRLVAEVDHGQHIVTQLGDAFGRLHAIDPALAPAAMAAPDEPVAAALDGVTLAIANLLQPEPAFSYVLRWLREHRPTESASRRIVHADVRTGNIIVDRTGLRSILDWETAKIGDPIEDLAWVCTRMWRFGEDHLTVGGLGTVDTLRDAYVAAGGTWDDERFRWWRVLVTMRWGTGLAGQAAMHLDGRFSSVVMAASGRRVTENAYDALMLIDAD